MQGSVELSLHLLRHGMFKSINMHKSLSQMFLLRPLCICKKSLSCDFKSLNSNSKVCFCSKSDATGLLKIKPFLLLNSKRFFRVLGGSLKLDLRFRALMIVTSAAVSLKSNMEQAAKHKRLACVLFLDLCLKGGLSARATGKAVSGKMACCLFLK